MTFEFLSTIRPAIAAAVSLVVLALPAGPANAVDEAHPDWPCIQGKVEELTPAQFWDGPPIDEFMDNWWKDDGVRKLVPVIISRRNPMEDVEAKIEEFAQATPEAERDARLTRLFAGVMDETNKVRRRVLVGIERFERRQKARATALEKKGLELTKLLKRAKEGEKISAIIDEAQRTYDWDARIFKERNDNIPLACEIPVDIDQRAFALAQTIRFQFVN